MLARVDTLARRLAPSAFAVVMANGIIAVGLQASGQPWLSLAPALIAATTYLLLGGLTVVRLVRHRDAVDADLRDPDRSFGFCTFVAGSNVLATLTVARGWTPVTVVLFVLAGTVWLVLDYLLPYRLVLARRTEHGMAAANGGWFLWAVASQSVAIVAASLQVAAAPEAGQLLAVVAVLAWSVGLFHYALVGVVVLVRLVLRPVRPEDVGPPYWVSMGALAITVVAGSRVLEMTAEPIIDATRDLIAGLSVIVWCVATWMLPLLLIAGWWRHIRHRVSLRYEAGMWSMVFPMGMYAVAGMDLGRVDRLPLVELIGSTWLWVAVAVWVAVTVGAVVRTGPALIPARR